MKLHILTVRDIVADVFGQPFYALSIGGAVRGFADAINGQDANLSKHPADYELFRLGTYDDNSAEFDIGRLERVAVGRDLVIPSSQSSLPLTE